MNQSTVPHTEVSLRLTILSEFLFDEEKPIEELYKNWMRRVGGRIMEYTEFEYWYRRFKNDQFDLGYDTSQDENAVFGIPNGIKISNDNRSETYIVEVNIDLEYDICFDSKEILDIQNTIVPEANGEKDVSTMAIESDEKSGNETAVVPNEIPEAIKEEEPVERVEKQTEDSKLNHQFNEKNVPEIFKTLIEDRKNDLKQVYLIFNDLFALLVFDDIHIRFERYTANWIITYEQLNEVIVTIDPEKSIIDHLWFVLKNPNIKLKRLLMFACNDTENRNSQKIDFGKLDTLLYSAFDTFDHLILTTLFVCTGFNEDTFLLILKHIKPWTLKSIASDISWKEEGNYQKMEEIVGTYQWIVAKNKASTFFTPLKIDNFLQDKKFSLKLERITIEDMLRVVEHYLNSVETESRPLLYKEKNRFQYNRKYSPINPVVWSPFGYLSSKIWKACSSFYGDQVSIKTENNQNS